MHDGVPSPLLKKQSTTKTSLYLKAAKLHVALSLTSLYKMGKQGLFKDIFKDFQIIWVTEAQISVDDFANKLSVCGSDYQNWRHNSII